MAASIDFYTNKMGLKLLGGPHHYPGHADMAFVGSSWDAYIELVSTSRTIRRTSWATATNTSRSRWTAICPA